MATAEENCAKATRAGYDVLGRFPLPAQDWWQDYYTPLRKRCGDLSREATGNAGLEAVLAETREEIDMFERFSTAYSYVFYVLRK
jgi:serine/threonine-protein kinase HipA